MTRNPVTVPSGIVAAISTTIMLGLGMAVSLHWLSLDPDQMGAIEKFVLAILGLLIPIAPFLVALWSRTKVTPVADPHLPGGEPAALVPRQQAQQMAASVGLHRPGRGDEEYTRTVGEDAEQA